MAIRKLVKLDHPDDQINRVQRNVEDVLGSVQVALSSGSLVSSLSGTLNGMFGPASQTASLDQRYVLARNYSAFSGALNSFTGSADFRYVLTSSYAPFTTSVATFTASQNTFNAAHNTFSASANTFTGSVNTFSASVNRFTASADTRYVLTASLPALTDKRYLLTSSLNTQAVTGNLTLLSGVLTVAADSPAIQISTNLPGASFPTPYLGLTSNLHDWRIYNNSSGHLAVYDNTPGVGAYRFRIDTNGNVGIGTTPNEALEVAGIIRGTGYRCRTGNGGSYGGNLSNLNWTGTACQLWIDNTNVGTISTTSDRRLKQNIAGMTGSALNTLARLNPVTFNWRDVSIYKDDGQPHTGFIADELQKVIPNAVNGLPSGSMPDGTPAYQTLVPSEIDPFVIKAIQEISGTLSYLQTTVAVLSASNAALTKIIKPLGQARSNWLSFWRRSKD